MYHLGLKSTQKEYLAVKLVLEINTVNYLINAHFQINASYRISRRPLYAVKIVLDAPRQGLSQAAPLRQSRTAIGIVPLKNGQGDNLSPSKFREKTRKEAHTKRFISVQKLQAETERGKNILSHV